MTSRVSTLLAGTALTALMLAGPASAEDPVTLRVTSIFPGAHFLWTEGGQVFADAVTETSGGEISFEVYHAGQLGNDQLAVLDSGLAEIGVIAAPYVADRMPLSGVVELPGIIEGACDGTNRYWSLAQSGGLLDELEYGPLGLHVLFVTTPPPYKIMTTGAEVSALPDLEGLKLRTVGGAQADTVRALGGTPVQVQAPELYDSLSRGTVDGAIYAFVGMPPFSLEEVVHHSVEGAYAGSVAVLYAVSTEAWEEMPAERQAILTEAAAMAQQHVCEFQDGQENALRDQYVAENGFSITTLTEAAAEEFRAAMAPVAEAWVGRMQENGLRGADVLAGYAAD